MCLTTSVMYKAATKPIVAVKYANINRPASRSAEAQTAKRFVRRNRTAVIDIGADFCFWLWVHRA